MLQKVTRTPSGVEMSVTCSSVFRILSHNAIWNELCHKQKLPLPPRSRNRSKLYCSIIASYQSWQRILWNNFELVSFNSNRFRSVRILWESLFLYCSRISLPRNIAEIKCKFAFQSFYAQGRQGLPHRSELWITHNYIVGDKLAS